MESALYQTLHLLFTETYLLPVAMSQIYDDTGDILGTPESRGKGPPKGLVMV